MNLFRKLLPMVLFVFIICLCASEASAKTVIVNKKNFPDKAVREALFGSKLGDKLKKSYLNSEHILHIECENRKVDLKGIEYFSNLSKLELSESARSREFPQIPKLKELTYVNHAAETLKLPRYPKLKKVYIYGMNLNSLDLSNNMQICTLGLGARLQELDVSQFFKLEVLALKNMNLPKLDLMYNLELRDLKLENMSLPELDLSNNKKLVSVSLRRVSGFTFNPALVGKLKELTLDAQGMETFEVSNHPALQTLELKNDSKLQKIVIKDCKKLKTLIIKKNSSLQEIQIEGCAKLKELTVQENPLLGSIVLGEDVKLTLLSIKNCKKVTSLEQMNLSQLLKLRLVDTSVSKLPTERFPNIKELSVYENPIKKIDIRSLKNLRKLDIRYEKSTKSLDVSKLSRLSELKWTDGVLEKVNFGKNNRKTLWKINLSDNKLSGKWDMGAFKHLDGLRLNNNRITSIDLGELKQITDVYCRNNRLKTFNAGECCSIITLDCRDNPGVKIYMFDSDDVCMDWRFGKKSKVYYKYG